MFLKKIGTYLLALWAGFLRLIFPQPQQPISTPSESPKEVPVNDKTQFISRLRALGNRDSYQATVDAAQAKYQPLTTADWSGLLAVVDQSVRLGSPGHDFGHSRRDVLGAFALASDKNLAQYHPAEVVAGMLAGTLHDLGTAFTPRYRDFETIYGHAEDGAWRVWEVLHGHVEENLLLITCYAIAAHTHYTQAMNCKDGTKREPWWYELFETSDGKYGWAVLACRFADRLDTNGSTLAIRHLLANADALESGGQDLTGKTFYDINRASIQVMVTPRKAMVEVGDGKKAPTTIQHVVNFAGSNFGASVYSRDDHLFPTMTRLMGYKVSQALNIAAITGDPNLPYPSVFAVNPMNDLKTLLYRASRAPRFDDAWQVLETAFSELTPEELATWSRLVQYLSDSYDLWLVVLKSIIRENANQFTTPVLPLIDSLAAEIS